MQVKKSDGGDKENLKNIRGVLSRKHIGSRYEMLSAAGGCKYSFLARRTIPFIIQESKMPVTETQSTSMF